MSDEAIMRTGGCACDALRYELVGEPIFVNNCHCSRCQRQTGSTSVVNMFFETEALTQLSGETTQHVVKTGSGRDVTIIRCAACGTAMWSMPARLGTLLAIVRAGTLDDPGGVRPDAVIYTADRMPWVTLPEGIPHFAESYDPAELLPPDRVARFQALVARRAAGEG